MSKVKAQAETADETTKQSPAADVQREPPHKADGPALAARQPAREEPPARPARAAREAFAPEEQRGAAGRARALSGLQRSVGNARLNRLLSREEESPGGVAAAASRADDEKIRPLSVSHPDDASEREAEAVARSVAEGKQAPPITPLSSAGVRTLATARGDEKQDDKPPALRAAETEPAPGLAQRRETDADDRGLDTAAAAAAVARKGPGRPLDPSVRSALEPRLGADLSAARVHTDSDAQEAARAINARAFTHGRDIFLARGESERDTRLMAHELTHVVQHGHAPGVARRAAADEPPAVSRQEKEEGGAPAPVQRQKGKGKPAAELPPAPGFIDLKGMSEFKPPDAVAEFLNTNRKAVVQMRYGKWGEGPVEISKQKDADKYTVRRQKIPLRHPLLVGVGEELQPGLIIKIKDTKIEGFLGLTAAQIPDDNQKLAGDILKAPEMLGLNGFDFNSKPKLVNELKAGKLSFGLRDIEVKIGSAFATKLTLEAVDEAVNFKASAKVTVKGLAEGALELARAPSGAITGQVALGLELTKEFTGAVTITWAEAGVSGTGKIGYKGEKMSGEITLVLMEKGAATALKAAKEAPPEEAMAQADGAPAPAAKTSKKESKPKKLDYVVFGEGDLTFAFNDWLNGTAHVIVDPDGYVTIIGKITPQKEFPLFEPKEFVKPIFKVEARASYGIPVVGNIFIFANFGMDAFAKLEGKLYNIEAEGTYSTDPREALEFQIKGSLNISAAAGLRLRGEVGAGLEILGHDLKVGAGINGIVGVKAYAEATPIIGYREKPSAEGEDKKGEFFIRGDVEVAAQPFLGLSGDLFLEIDAPWWSPLDDDRTTWPLFNLEYPLGGSFGLLMSVDYVFGSGQWPAVEFKPAEFDADKFTADLYEDRAKKKSGEPGDKQGAWKEKNEPRAEPPPEPKSDARKEKAKQLPPAKSKVARGGPKKGSKKEADPNARTADGKTVKQHEAEAKKKGKKPKVKDPKTGQEKDAPDEKDSSKKAQSAELRAGLAALDAAVGKYKEGGVTREEIADAVKAVRKKHKVFKSIQFLDDGVHWDLEYTYNPTVKEEDFATKGEATEEADDGEHKGTGVLRKGQVAKIRAEALAALDKIKTPADVGGAMPELALGDPDIIARYKGDKPNSKGVLEGYKQYMAPSNKKEGDQFEWPITYMKLRASRKKGRLKEDKWVKKLFAEAKKGTYQVEQAGGDYLERIPDGVTDDYVIDSKDVIEQSFTAQLRDFYVIAYQHEPGKPMNKREVLEGGMGVRELKGKERGEKQVTKKRGLVVIVRGKTKTQKETETSKNLRQYADVRWEITDEEEDGS